MKNTIRRRIYKKFHSIKRKKKKNKRKYFSQYKRHKKYKISIILQQKTKIPTTDVAVNTNTAIIKSSGKVIIKCKYHITNNKAPLVCAECIPVKNQISENLSSKVSKANTDTTKLNGIETPERMILVGYNIVYGDPIPKTRDERLEIIKNIPKEVIIHNIASINYLQREFNNFTYNISEKLQWENVTYWLGPEKCKIYKKLIIEYLEKRDIKNTVIFNRAANLFILQEVIYYGANLEYEGFDESAVMEDIFKYYLSVNSFIGNAKIIEEDENFTFFEKLAASNLFIDTLQFANNPIFILERYPELINYLRSKSELNTFIATHFRPYGYDPEQMLKYIAELYFNLAQIKPKYLAPFINIPTDDLERVKVLDSISKLRSEISLEHDYDLTRLKKSPLYKVPNKWYIILDHDFLIQKLYQFSINDFYFDYIKPNSTVNYAFYAAQIGLFFENYVSKILKKSFKNPDVTLKTLDELKTKKPGSEIELADFYIRKGNNIILGQVKASALNTEQNKGTVESLFSNKKDFLSDFGVKQTFETIQYLKKYPEEFDNQLKENESYYVYPVIVLNESITSSTAICLLFNDILNNMLKLDSFPNLEIKYITLLHVQDLERIAPLIEIGSHDFFDILEENMRNSMPKPLEITLDRLDIVQVHSLDAHDYRFMRFANYHNDIQ